MKTGGPERVSIGALGRLLRRPWYGFWKLVERGFYAGREYTLAIPYGYRVLTPWFASSRRSGFPTVLHNARSRGPVSMTPDRCFMIYQWATFASNLAGDFAECGVFTGGSADILAQVLTSRSPQRGRLLLFDTFAGMPSSAQPDRDYHSPGDFSGTDLESVRARLVQILPICEFHKGRIPETFSGVDPGTRLAFAHVDVDIYSAIADACSWVWPRLVPGGVLLIDDYGLYPYRFAARAAVDEFFADKPGRLIALPTGQALAIHE